MCEFAKTNTERHQVVVRDAYGCLHAFLGDVVDSVPVQTETEWLVWPVDQVGDVPSDILCEFLKECFCLFFSQWAHLVGVAKKKKTKCDIERIENLCIIRMCS
jgi:hypothetical protein